MRKWFFISTIAVLLSGFPPAIAQQTISPVSETAVVQTDVITAKEGKAQIGKPVYAIRKDQVVRWFATEDNMKRYSGSTGSYPGLSVFSGIAFYGADIVARFPEGRHVEKIGPLVSGNPARFTATYRGSVFAFESVVNRDRFAANPAEYVPEVGAYCLGAMSQGRITHGDPRHVLYLRYSDERDGGRWVVFGSSNGPKAWATLTPREVETRQQVAWVNYSRHTSH